MKHGLALGRISVVLSLLVAHTALCQDYASAQQGLVQAQKAGTEIALAKFLQTRPPADLATAARASLCALRHPNNRRSPKLPNDGELLIQYLLAEGCDYAPEIHSNLLAAYRRAAVKAGRESQFDTKLLQPFGRSVDRVMQELRDRAPLGPTPGFRDNVLIEKTHPLEFKLSRFDADLRLGQPGLPTSFRADDEDVTIVGIALIESTALTFEAGAGSNKQVLSKGHLEVSGQFFINGNRLHCSDGSASFSTWTSLPEYSEGLRCTFGGDSFVRQRDQWKPANGTR